LLGLAELLEQLLGIPALHLFFLERFLGLAQLERRRDREQLRQ
jgi:hypothetical protein